MRPDTSRWREQGGYDYFDRLATEGLAWECLRRHEPYQDRYQALLGAREDSTPLTLQDQRRWGLRFPGTAESVRAVADRVLVAGRGPDRADPQLRSGPPVRRVASGIGRH